MCAKLNNTIGQFDSKGETNAQAGSSASSYGRICTEMDDEIEIQSEQGVGTKVIVTLPVDGNGNSTPA